MHFPWQNHASDLQREPAHHLAELMDEFIRCGHTEQAAAPSQRNNSGVRNKSKRNAATKTLGVLQHSRAGTPRRRAPSQTTIIVTEPHNVIWLVLKEALALTAIGLVLGAPAIYFGSRFLEKELFELKPLNPILIGASLLLLATAATIAAWIPARRAASLDPASALRQH